MLQKHHLVFIRQVWNSNCYIIFLFYFDDTQKFILWCTWNIGRLADVDKISYLTFTYKMLIRDKLMLAVLSFVREIQVGQESPVWEIAYLVCLHIIRHKTNKWHFVFSSWLSKNVTDQNITIIRHPYTAVYSPWAIFFTD